MVAAGTISLTRKSAFGIKSKLTSEPRSGNSDLSSKPADSVSSGSRSKDSGRLTWGDLSGAGADINKAFKNTPVPMASKSRAARLAELRGKYGDRFRKNLSSGISERDAAFASVRSARRKVQKLMHRDSRMKQLLQDGDYMTYGFILDARVKSRLFSPLGSRIQGLRKNVVVYRPGGKGYVKGDYRVPDFSYQGTAGLEHWDLKSPGFNWNQQLQDILDWTNISPTALKYRR